MAITNHQFLQCIYVAYWCRAADPKGFYYWDNLYDAGILDFAGIAENFAASTEGQDNYLYFKIFFHDGADAITDAQRETFIDSIYQNLFNHTPDAEGKAYWLDQLKSGAVGPGAFIATIAYSAIQAADDDCTVIENKAAAAEYFTQQILNSGYDWTQDICDSCKVFLMSIDGATTEAQWQTKADTIIAEVVSDAQFALTADSTQVQEGSTITYTVTLDEAATEDAEVTFQLLPGDTDAADTGTTFTNMNDFGSGSFQLQTATITAGSSTASFTASPVADGITEFTEAFSAYVTVDGMGARSITSNALDGDGGSGQTFTLTTGVDVIPGLVGYNGTTSTAGDDTIVGTWTDNRNIAAGTGGYGGTLNSGDNLNAGDGTNTLEVTVNNTNTNAASTTVVTGFTAANLQRVLLTASGAVVGNTATYDASTTTAGAEFWSDASTRGVIFDDIQQNATIGLMGGTDQSVTATFKDSIVSGNSDTGTLELNGAGDASIAPGNTITLQGKTTASAGFETIDVVNSGNASRIGTLQTGDAGDVLRTLNISGSASVRIDTVNSSRLDTINASSLTGSAGFAVGATASTQTDLVFTGSANDDWLSIDGLNTANSFDFYGGGGTDILVVGDAAAFTQAGAATLVDTVNSKVSGFEVLEIGNIATRQLKADDFDGIHQFRFGVTAENLYDRGAPVITVTGVEDADTFTVGSDQIGVIGSPVLNPNNATVAMSFAGALTGQKLNLVLDSQTGVDIVGGEAGKARVIFSGVDAAPAISLDANIITLAIDSSGESANTIVGGAGGDGHSTDVNLDGGDAAFAIDNIASPLSVTVVGDQDLTVAGGACGADSAGAGGSASLEAFSNAVEVDAAGFTAKLTIAGSTGTDEVIVGSGGSELHATQGADDYTFGNGDDTLVYTNVNQSLTSVADDAAILNSIDTITGWGAGSDTIDVNGLVLAGTGTLAEVNFIDQATTQAAVDAASPSSLKEAAVAAGAFIQWDKISVFQYGGNTYVLGQDNSGAFAASDLFIQIIGEHSLTSENFVFA